MVVVEGGPGGKAQGRFLQGLDAGEQLIPVFGILKPLPPGQPVDRVGGPVRTHPHMGVVAVFRRVFAEKAPHGVLVVAAVVHVLDKVHHVPHPLVGGQVVVKAVVPRRGNPGLLGPAAPVADIVPGAQHGEFAQVVGVHLAGVAAHGAGEAVNLIVPGAQEGQPVDIGVAQLGVVPGKAPHIIPPAVADRVVGVHHVAVIPEAVPLALLHLPDVEADVFQQGLFIGGFLVFGVLGLVPPGPEHAGILVDFRVCHQQGVGLQVGGKVQDCLLAGHPVKQLEGELVGVGNPLRNVHHPAVGVLMGNGVIGAEVHGFGIAAPQP